jgi:glutamate/tyrosine decarboxylase-like PLP-dependent enzyme
MWLPLQLFGVAPFRAALQEKLGLCRLFYHEIRKRGFEVGPPPELSVCIYRYLPREGDANEFNRQLVEAVHRDGKVFISSTTIDGQVWLRLAVLSFRTHLHEIDYLLEFLPRMASELEKTKRSTNNRGDSFNPVAKTIGGHPAGGNANDRPTGRPISPS